MTANDSDVSDGDKLTGSQVVRVYGQNLTYPFVTLTFGDVEYTPLYRGEGYIEFILNDNGTATINVDGSRFMSFEVEGVVVPTGLPTYIAMGQAETPNGTSINVMQGNLTCLNYPRLVDETHQYFRLVISGSNPPWGETDFNDFEGHNCNIQRVGDPRPDQLRIAAFVEDKENVAYITYQGFIIAVFNYTTE